MATHVIRTPRCSLLGLRPFLNELMPLTAGLESGQCRTLHAVTKLIVLREKALSKAVSRQLSSLRNVFAAIDPAFCGTVMQDAKEFLLRLLDTIKAEIDTRCPTQNPVRNNFQYQFIEQYTCSKCHKIELKHQDCISWFVGVPHRQDTDAPTLQDALRLSMQPDRRERSCQQCHHGICCVTARVSQLPKVL